jgi:flagellar hook assembly protein FlgD
MRTVAITALVFGLFAGTAAAFVLTVSLKLDRSPVSRVRFDSVFSPTCGCSQELARIRFRVRRVDRIDVEILQDDRVVRNLVRDELRRRGALRLTWDGKNDSGEVVPDGGYRLRVRFRAGETIDVPGSIQVDTRPPDVQLTGILPDTFSPDGDGRVDEVAVDYVAGEASTPVVLVDGARAYEGPFGDEGESRFFWDGTVAGRTLPPGSYFVALQARDRAGNTVEAEDPKIVRIRYVDVTPDRLSVRRGGVLRFRVETDAATFAWRLRSTGAGARAVLRGDDVQRRSVSVRLPRRLLRGRYVLRVRVNGHEDVAVVRVMSMRA